MTDPFDIPLEQLRRRRSAKWSRAEGSIPAWVAEMDVHLAEPITAALHDAVELSDTGYAGDGSGYFEAFAGFAADRWGWQVDSALCVGYADLNASGVALLRQFVGDDGRVLITPPVYNAFYLWLGEAGLTPVEVTLRDEPYGAPDLDEIERALAGGVRVVLISNPHNPFGRLWRRDELAHLADLAAQHGATVLSDEIHAPLTFPGQEFVPFLTVSDAARAHGIAMHSASKAWNLAGLKASLVVRAPEGPTFDTPIELPWSLGHFGLIAGEVAFREGVPWLDDIIARLADRATLVHDRLTTELPGIRLPRLEASYLQWLDLREVMPGVDDPAAVIRERTDVFLSRGPEFGSVGRGCARLNIATSEAILDQVLDSIVAAARGAASGPA